MRHLASYMLLAALIACGPSASSHGPAPETPDTTKAKKATEATPAIQPIDAAHLTRALDAYVAGFGSSLGETSKFNGYVHVEQAGKVLYARAFGFSDRAAKRQANADTNFRIGSVTKQFTAAAIMLLVQEGKVSLTDPVKKYIPDYPAVGAGITIHQLLSHTAGLPNYTNNKSLMDSRETARSPRELVKTFWDKPLDFAPGSKWAYSNSGYVLLGVVIEKVSGKPYAEFMRQRIFWPAGLTRTVVGDAAGMDNRAEGYAVKDDAIVPARKIAMSNAYAAGAIRSTATDLAKWHRVLTGTTLLSESSKKKLFTPVMKDYAYGWMVKTKKGRRMIGHGGGIDGFVTDYRRVPASDVVVVVWSNFESPTAPKVGGAAVVASFGETPEPIKEPKLTAVAPKRATRCAGSYVLSPASRTKLAKMAPPAVVKSVATLTVTGKGGGLHVKPVGQPGFVAKLGTDNLFHNPTAGIKVHCAPGAGTAPVPAISLEQGPFKLEYTRAAAK